MKKFFIALAVFVFVFLACDNGNTDSNRGHLHF